MQKVERTFTEQATDSIKTIKKRVRTILEQEPNTRGNDSILLIRYLERFKGVETMKDLKQLAIDGGISFESVRRVRQQIQNRDSEFLPDKETFRKRQKMTKVFQKIGGEQVDPF